MNTSDERRLVEDKTMEREPREIPAELDKLDAITQDLLRAVVGINETLGPVLSVGHPDDQSPETKEPTTLCDVAQRIRGVRVSIETSLDGLEELHSRVEL